MIFLCFSSLRRYLSGNCFACRLVKCNTQQRHCAWTVFFSFLLRGMKFCDASNIFGDSRETMRSYFIYSPFFFSLSLSLFFEFSRFLSLKSIRSPRFSVTTWIFIVFRRFPSFSFSVFHRIFRELVEILNIPPFLIGINKIQKLFSSSLPSFENPSGFWEFLRRTFHREIWMVQIFFP